MSAKPFSTPASRNFISNLSVHLLLRYKLIAPAVVSECAQQSTAGLLLETAVEDGSDRLPFWAV
jgi:hypothetical protein